MFFLIKIKCNERTNVQINFSRKGGISLMQENVLSSYSFITAKSIKP